MGPGRKGERRGEEGDEEGGKGKKNLKIGSITLLSVDDLDVRNKFFFFFFK